MMCFIVPNKNTSTNSYYTTETQTENEQKIHFQIYWELSKWELLQDRTE